MKKLALILCLAMLLSILPASAIAAEQNSYTAAAEEALRLAEEAFPDALASDDPAELYASAQEYYNRYTARTPDGADSDLHKAYQLYLKAAELGLPEAQDALAGICAGTYPPELHNEEEAFRWALQAAEQGYMNAYIRVIYAYRLGSGTAQSEESAALWEEKLAAETAELLKEADSENADPEKLLQAAENCRYGDGTEKNIDNALEYYQRAAEAGSVAGARMLGNLYRQAYEVEKDISKSIEWYTKAWELGDTDSGSALAFIYRFGADESGTEKNPEKAVAILQGLAEKGYVPAQTDLADIYMSGEGVAWDSAKAFEWYLKAAEKDDACAEYSLSNIFQYGLAGPDYELMIEENRDLANVFLTRAADQGYPYAQEALNNLS